LHTSRSTIAKTRRFRAEWLTLGVTLVLLGAALSVSLQRERVELGTQESERVHGSLCDEADALPESFGADSETAGAKEATSS